MTSTRRRVAGFKARSNGKAFEKRLENAFEYYRMHRLALIEKTPEPVKQITGMDKSGRFTACYEKRAQPDYKGVLKGGKCIVLEAKYTDGDIIQLKRVAPHQIDKLAEYEALGAQAFVVVGFGSGNVYRIPASRWIFDERMGRSSYRESELEEYRVYDGNILENL